MWNLPIQPKRRVVKGSGVGAGTEATEAEDAGEEDACDGGAGAPAAIQARTVSFSCACAHRVMRVSAAVCVAAALLIWSAAPLAAQTVADFYSGKSINLIVGFSAREQDRAGRIYFGSAEE